MAIVGRLACPWCSCEAGHVKKNDGKHPYHHCPDCGLVTQAKSGAQAKLFTGRMRSDGPGAVPEQPATVDPIIVRGGASGAAAIAPVATAPAPAPVPKKPAGFWDQLAGKTE